MNYIKNIMGFLDKRFKRVTGIDINELSISKYQNEMIFTFGDIILFVYNNRFLTLGINEKIYEDIRNELGYSYEDIEIYFRDMLKKFLNISKIVSIYTMFGDDGISTGSLSELYDVYKVLTTSLDEHNQPIFEHGDIILEYCNKDDDDNTDTTKVTEVDTVGTKIFTMLFNKINLLEIPEIAGATKDEVEGKLNLLIKHNYATKTNVYGHTIYSITELGNKLYNLIK